jgi:hypothetical protein
MGEQTILVCDVCGRPAVETATIRVGGRNYVKDYCAQHLSELIAGGRAPRRGRRKTVTGPVSSAAPKRRGRPPKSASAKRKTTRARATAKKSTGRRRGRPRKTQSSS